MSRFGVRICFCSLVLGATAAAGGAPPPLRGLQEVGQERVEVRGGFWGPRLVTHRAVTVPHALDCLEKDGHVTNFDKAAGVYDGPLRGHHAFDSDLHKALEGAAYCLQQQPDSGLRARVDGILGRILAAQQQDGFLISCWIVQGLDKKWDDLRLQHQMYNAGHFFEMAVAYDRLGGGPGTLAAAKRFADHIDGTFGPGKRYDVDGHQEVELALVKLYRATGERRYLELARFFLDERGYAHGTERKPFDPSTVVEPPKADPSLSKEEQHRLNFQGRLRMRNGRMQDHKPVVEQLEAVGHAVRAGYMYAAMTDIVRFMDAPGYERALDGLWDDVVGRKMYLTGGIGTGQHDDEGFGDPYLLPNESAYCESCAAIAHVLWQHRMNLLKGQAQYADVMELALYNGVLSGISISGDRFRYQNPLASRGGDERRSWIGLACCPANLTRIIPQVGGLAYARGKREVFVNLYVAGEAALELDGGVKVKVAQETDYPWNGRVRLTVTPAAAAAFDLCLRIPGWALGRPVPGDLYRFDDPKVPPVGLKVNGEAVDAAPHADGYVHLQRTWKAGDVVELVLPMPIRRVHARDEVQDDRGKVALMRGPLVYCLEAADQPGLDLFRATLPRDAQLRAEHRPDLLGGVTVLHGAALAEGKESTPVTAIPAYAWGNREKGAMTVWLAEAADEVPASPQAVLTIDTDAPSRPYSPMIFGGFLEHFDHQVYGGVFEPGSPLSDTNGFRRDVIAALKELKIPIVRWPGGCYVSGYHWEAGVGRNRKPTDDMAWGVVEPNTFGTDEFVELCRLAGWQPYVCNNAGNGTVAEMRNWVEYCNGNTGTYAQLRRDNGYAEPRGVGIWSIGNENWGRHEIGYKPIEQWAPLVLEAAKAMKAADPRIQLTAAAVPTREWSLPLLKTAGPYLDYISIHGYWLPLWQKNDPPDYLTSIMQSDAPEQLIANYIGVLEESGCRGRIKIAFDEWNLRGWHHPGFPRKEVQNYSDPEVVKLVAARERNDIAAQYTMADALFSASFFNACLRHAEDVGMANIAPIVNTRGPLFVHSGGVVRRTHFHAMAMYANELEPRVGRMDVRADRLVHGAKSVAVVDAVATVSESGRNWSVALVNRHPEKEAACTINVKDRPLEGPHEAVVLAGDSPDAFNDVEHPSRVVPVRTTLTFAKGRVSLPPHSLTIVKVTGK